MIYKYVLHIYNMIHVYAIKINLLFAFYAM